MPKLMFHSLLFLCSLLLLSVLEAVASPYPNYPLTKGGKCRDKCGDVTIPFPFGFGANNCFLDEWYEILCVNNSIPRLKKLDLQVLNISFPRNKDSYDRTTITVNYPVVYLSSSCTHTHNAKLEPVTFEGGPFYFSTHNNFVAVGCEKSASVKGLNQSFFGCSTNCTGKNARRYSPCDGSDCCQSTVPRGLQGFGVDFQGGKILGTSGGDRGCQFAFLVSSIWFEPNTTDLYAIRDRGYAPASLRWAILDAAFPTTSIRLKPTTTTVYYSYQTGLTPMNLTSYTSEAATCFLDSINMNTTTFINCQCNSGFYGNPYIEDGCKDINECEIPLQDGSKRCGGLHKCRNTRGSSHCINTTLFIIIGLCSSFGPLLLIFLAWCACILIKKRRDAKLKANFFKQNGGLILQRQLSSPEGGSIEKGRLFNFKELESATDNFNKNRILGKGGQGTVYKGMLADGRIVAIKKSIAIDEENVEPFINEVVILSQINHRNVVKLLGCCLESEVPLLVYEFIPNGTLYQYLHDHEPPVSWESRLRIAIEAAGALFYLHSAASIPIYHRDIKSSNILLDEKHRAKIADFGTSMSIALDQTHVTTLVKGTFGYFDPEYFQSSQFTDKSDVYSFGVVLVELLTRQKPVSSLRENEGRSLATYFIISMEENRLFDILDAHIVEQGRADEITAVANLARRCLNLSGRKRPTMKEVSMELEGIRNPVQPASRIEENEEIRSDHVEATTSEGAEALFSCRGFEMDSEVISLSDVHPLLPGEAW